jgi:hypothetical protein
MIEVPDAGFMRLPRLAGHVDLAGWVLANQDDGEPGCHALCLQLCDPRRDTMSQSFRYRAAVNHCGAHEILVRAGACIVRCVSTVRKLRLAAPRPSQC